MRKFLASLLAASLVASMGVAAFANDAGAEAGEAPAVVSASAPGDSEETADPTGPAKTTENSEAADAMETTDKTTPTERSKESETVEKADNEENITADKKEDKTSFQPQSGETDPDSMPEAATLSSTGESGSAGSGEAAAEIAYPALASDTATSPDITLQVTEGAGTANQKVKLTGDVVYYPATAAGNPAGYMIGFTVAPPTPPTGYKVSVGKKGSSKFKASGGVNHTDGKWVTPGMWYQGDESKGFHAYFMPTKTQKTYTIEVEWVYTQDKQEDIYYHATYIVDASGAVLEDIATVAAGKLSWDQDTGGKDRGTLTNTDTAYSVSGSSTIAYYAGNPSVGNPSGWMVGLTIEPPKAGSGAGKLIQPDREKTTFSMTGGANVISNGHPHWFDDSSDKTHPSGSIHVYPMPTAESKKFEITVNWVDYQGETFPVQYTLDLSGSALAEKPGNVKLIYKGVKAEDDNKTPFDLNNYSGATAIEKGAQLNSVSIPDPSLNGYVFSGWYKQAALTDKVVFTDKADGETTLYAKFTKKIESNTVQETVNNEKVQQAASGDASTLSTQEKNTVATEIEKLLDDSAGAANLAQAAKPAEIETLDKAYQAVAEVQVEPKTELKNAGDGEVSSATIETGAALAAGEDAKKATVKLKVEAPAADKIATPSMENILGSNKEVTQVAQAKITLVVDKSGGSDTTVTDLKAPITL